MAIEGFKLEIDKTGRAVISTPKSQGSTSVDTRPTTLTSPSKLASLPATRATTPMQQHTASSQRLSQHGSDVDARREAGGDEQEQDDEGRTLLKQFTFASPSPKRKREASSSKRKKKVVRLEKAEVGRDDAEEGTKSYSRTRRLQTNPFSPHRVQSTYELPVPPHLIFATPAAPPPPHRLPSISTTLRPSLELGERDDFAEPSPNVTHVAPAALLAPPSPSPTLAADLLQLLERQGELPEGLMDLLEAHPAPSSFVYIFSLGNHGRPSRILRCHAPTAVRWRSHRMLSFSVRAVVDAFKQSR
ncbi:sperm nuclear basic protein PL-I isoform PLIb [Rhodotorula toruloides]|uniref:Sperm nuclear basic protein PL-I isoform PLIb n=1 Tax=Rhodotorula toruloides TaxID=5286 RepID=A0A511KKT6_RHOTO|nr:sperm nuclear basic protein PL-I isoform PLIb [Rhodotorula toruloides]